MELNQIRESIKGLTPEEKIKFFNLLSEKEKESREVQRLIEEAKEEQLRLEENLRRVEISRAAEPEITTEEPLEQLVDKLEEEQPERKEKSKQEIYGLEHLKYLSPAEADKERTERNYSADQKKIQDEPTQEERQNLISESKRLDKERKKYETSKV